jgi:hypothetical protein
LAAPVKLSDIVLDTRRVKLILCATTCPKVLVTPTILPASGLLLSVVQLKVPSAACKKSCRSNPRSGRPCLAGEASVHRSLLVCSPGRFLSGQRLEPGGPVGERLGMDLFGLRQQVRGGRDPMRGKQHHEFHRGAGGILVLPTGVGAHRQPGHERPVEAPPRRGLPPGQIVVSRRLFGGRLPACRAVLHPRTGRRLRPALNGKRLARF